MTASSGPHREQIVVRVAPDGTISAETRGMKGAKCLDYVAVLEELLEASTTSSAFTAEYSETAQHQQTETHTYDEARNDLHQR
jgi:hypothetical protein